MAEDIPERQEVGGLVILMMKIPPVWGWAIIFFYQKKNATGWSLFYSSEYHWGCDTNL
jgi:hypothetical protein